MKIEPQTKSDEARLVALLHDAIERDSDFSFQNDPESGELILGGLSELQLDQKIDDLRRQGIQVACGAPQVSYRETIAREIDVDYTHKRRRGGVDEFARVILRLAPRYRGDGNRFTSSCQAPPPGAYLKAIEKGVKSIWTKGVAIGFPLVDTSVDLGACIWREAEGPAVSFEIATRAAMKEACNKAGIVVLEPFMTIELMAPDEFAKPIIRDLEARRGEISSRVVRGDRSLIRALAPLANLFGYSSDLKRLTREQGTFSTAFSEYRPVPRNIAGPDDDPPVAMAL